MRSFKKIAVIAATAAIMFGMVSALGAGTSKADKKLVAGLICLHNEICTYDQNMVNDFKAACEEHGLVKGETYLYATGVEAGEDSLDMTLNMAERGCTVVFTTCFGYEYSVVEALPDAPDNSQICQIPGSQAHLQDYPNYQNAYAAIHEGRYLTGVAAGMKLNEMITEGKITEEDAKIGYVGTFTYAEVISDYTAFYLGAKSVCPGVAMEVTFTGSWFDEDIEKEAAQKLIDSGCVLITQHTDSDGVPAVCEEAGIPNVSGNGSNLSTAPNTFLISSRICWTPYMSYCMDCVINDEDIDTDWVGDFETGSVILTEVNKEVAAEGTEEALSEVQAKLESGEIQVFDVSTFTVNGETITSYLVDDTEVIVDGAFQESTLRSAPYFDLMIDGITLLDTAEF